MSYLVGVTFNRNKGEVLLTLLPMSKTQEEAVRCVSEHIEDDRGALWDGDELTTSFYDVASPEDGERKMREVIAVLKLAETDPQLLERLMLSGAPAGPQIDPARVDSASGGKPS